EDLVRLRGLADEPGGLVEEGVGRGERERGVAERGLDLVVAAEHAELLLALALRGRVEEHERRADDAALGVADGSAMDAEVAPLAVTPDEEEVGLVEG